MDTCLSCQAAIETLLQVEASHLFKSSLAELTQSGGCGVRAQVVIDQTGGVTDALDDLPRRDLETEAASRIDGQSAIDQGQITTDVDAGGTKRIADPLIRTRLGVLFLPCGRSATGQAPVRLKSLLMNSSTCWAKEVWVSSIGRGSGA